MKKRKCLSGVVLSALLSVLPAVVTAQQVAKSYAAPSEVKIDRLVRQNFPQYFGRRLTYPQLEAETFYPIGWSKDGKFAYYTEPVDEACGCYFAYLAIQDIRTDKVVWEFKYNQDDTRDPENGENMKGAGNIAELWKANKKLFSEKLAENGIVAVRSTMLGKTFTIAGKSFTAKATEKLGKDPDGDYRRVNYYTVSLTSPKLGTKQLFKSEDHTKDEYWYMLNAGLIGAIKSPYENRVAIVALEVKRGYEGPPHTGDIRIAGADLTSGFGK